MPLDLFTYHAPTPITTPLYAAVRQAEALTGKGFEEAASMLTTLDRQARHDLVNNASRHFAGEVLDSCPECDERKLAVDAIRLARMRMNEYLVTGSAMDWRSALIDARMWACAAIAVHTAE